MIQSDKYYKSRAVIVTSEVGLTTDRRPLELTVFASLSAFACFRNTASFILPPYRKSCGTSHYILLVFMALSTIVGYSMLNLLYAYILNIYDLV